MNNFCKQIATKVDFQYFGHIFVWATTRGKGLTCTITIFFHQTNYSEYSMYTLLSQLVECCYLNKMWPKILGLRMDITEKSIFRHNLRSMPPHPSIGHQKKHPKISDSLLSTVQCPKITLSSVKFPGSCKSMTHFLNF